MFHGNLAEGQVGKKILLVFNTTFFKEVIKIKSMGAD